MLEIYGTSYFPTIMDAHNYYVRLGFTLNQVIKKVKDREIHIGVPRTTKNRKAVLHNEYPNSRRYYIHEIRTRQPDQ